MTPETQKRPITYKVAFHIQATFASIIFLILYLRTDPLPDDVFIACALSLFISSVGACVAWLRWNREETI